MTFAIIRAALQSKEVGDLQVLIEMAAEAGLIDMQVVADRATRKREKLARYMQSAD